MSDFTSSGNASGSYAFGTRLMITRAYTWRLASKNYIIYQRYHKVGYVFLMDNFSEFRTVQ